MVDISLRTATVILFVFDNKNHAEFEIYPIYASSSNI